MVGMVMVGADDPKHDGMHSYDATCYMFILVPFVRLLTTTFLFFKCNSTRMTSPIFVS